LGQSLRIRTVNPAKYLRAFQARRPHMQRPCSGQELGMWEE
jgi:hypothetical protein